MGRHRRAIRRPRRRIDAEGVFQTGGGLYANVGTFLLERHNRRCEPRCAKKASRGDTTMKHWLIALALVICAAAKAADAVPEIPFDSVPGFLKLPPDMYLGEVAGVAVNSKGHVFVFSRGNTTRPGLWGGGRPAAGVRCRRQVHPRDRPQPLRVVLRAHGAHRSSTTTSGSPTRARTWSSSSTRGPRGDGVRAQAGSVRRGHRAAEASEAAAAGRRRTFRQVTDVTWDPAGNTYISDGYINSRVAKVDKNGNWLKSWGEPGSQPGQFNTPHSIAADAQGHIYVADRGNRRIQVFDGDGKFLRQITIDVPFDHAVRPAIGNIRRSGCEVGHHRARRAMDHLHHARPASGAVCSRRLSRPHLQAQSRREGAGRARQRRASSSSSSAGFTRSPALRRTSSTSPNC